MMCSLLYFAYSEEVLVYKTVERKSELAKVWPNDDEDANGHDRVVHSRNMNRCFMAMSKW